MEEVYKEIRLSGLGINSQTSIVKNIMENIYKNKRTLPIKKYIIIYKALRNKRDLIQDEIELFVKPEIDKYSRNNGIFRYYDNEELYGLPHIEQVWEYGNLVYENSVYNYTEMIEVYKNGIPENWDSIIS